MVTVQEKEECLDKMSIDRDALQKSLLESLSVRERQCGRRCLLCAHRLEVLDAILARLVFLFQALDRLLPLLKAGLGSPQPFSEPQRFVTRIGELDSSMFTREIGLVRYIIRGGT